MKLPILLMLVITWFLVVVSGFAQDKQFERISLEDGLSHASVYAITQDRYGFLWFGTLSGLNKYDGYQFRVFKSDPDNPNSLSESFINNIVEDRKGYLWIGTFARGLNRFYPKTEQFRHYFDNPDSAFHLVNSRINVLVMDSQDPDILWIGSSKKGLIEFNTVSEKFKIYSTSKESEGILSSNNISAVAIDTSHDQKILWIGTKDMGLNKVNTKTGKIVYYRADNNQVNSLSNNTISNLIQDPDDDDILWIATDRGLNKFNKKTEEFKHFIANPKDESGISDDRVYELLFDRDGNFWIGTNNGLNLMNRKNGSFKSYFSIPSKHNTLSQNSIFSIYQDRSGIIWIGTDNGINKFDPLKERFQIYQHEPGNDHSLGQNYVRDLVRDPTDENIYWIATHGGGLEKFNYKTGKFTHYRHSDDDPNTVGSDEIYDLCLDYRNNLWIAHADGLDFFDILSGDFVHFPNNSTYRIAENMTEVITLFADSDNILWIGTWGGGIRRLDISKFYKTGRKPDQSGHFFLQTRGSKFPGLNDNSVVWFFQEESGDIWIATIQGGINLWNKTSGKMSYLMHDIQDNKSISHNYVTVVFQSRNKNIWVGTRGGGLNKYDKDTKSFRYFTEKDGLASDAVLGIQEDHKGYLWLNTVNGLSKFDPITETFKNYDVRDGLQSNQFYGMSYFDPDKQIMFVGGINGFNAFSPQHLPDNDYVPQVAFTRFQKQDLTKKKYTIENIPGINLKEKIRLTYRDDFISIEFAALDFHNSNKNQYQYKLTPLKDRWIYIGNKNRLTFTNLEPGDYVLQVRGSNDDGKWNMAGTHLGIEITPPWWKTNWAYLSYIFASLSLLFIIDRFQRRKIIRKEREKAQRQKEELILKQAEELELIDGIVRSINREYDLKTVLETLLKQGLKLFPQAENGAVLMYNKQRNQFEFSAAVGYDGFPIERVSFSIEEMTGYYADSAEEVEKGVYLVRHFKNISNTEKFDYLPIPKSLILMSATWDRKLEGFVIFANLNSNEAFDQSDARKLKRFREHAISAIIKSVILHELINKNEKLINTREQLVTQQKLASLGQLTAGIAHEIKNPLNFVNNFSELSIELMNELEEDLYSQEKNIPRQVFEDSRETLKILKENISKIAHHGNRADRIIRSMLLHSRGEEGVFAKSMINSVLEESLNLAYHGMRAQNSNFNAIIEVELDPDVGMIDVVPQNINRVFLNIFQNAFYAISKMDDQGKNGLKNKHREPTLRVQSKNLGDSIEIRIWDNGPGIPHKAQSQIFNPFFSTKPTGEGTGLGLSIAYDIVVHEHKGNLTFNTRENEYTEFLITLPRKKAS